MVMIASERYSHSTLGGSFGRSSTRRISKLRFILNIPIAWKTMRRVQNVHMDCSVMLM